MPIAPSAAGWNSLLHRAILFFKCSSCGNAKVVRLSSPELKEDLLARSKIFMPLLSQLFEARVHIENEDGEVLSILGI